MECFQGKTACSGIVIGRVSVFNKKEYAVKRVDIKSPENELRHFKDAKELTRNQLNSLYEQTLLKTGEESAAIFKAHRMIVDDLSFNEAIERMICEQYVNAEYAVISVAKRYADMFSNMDDDYMKARVADMKDIAFRIVRNLSGIEEYVHTYTEPSVIVADDLTPSETVQMDKDKILAFVTVQGSVNSHMAILARMMNIPAIVGAPLNIQDIESGTEIIVDGFTGNVYLNPTDTARQEAIQKMSDAAERNSLLSKLKGRENITLSGKKIEICANVGDLSDIGSASVNDAGGIGLFRTEFLYMSRNNFPTEQEQFEVYKKAAEMMKGRKVVIRTIDIGADKQADYLGIEEEANPALGYRAIRICLTQPEIFKVQLRAIFRAAVYGNIAMMYPMITSVEEVQKIQKIVTEVKAELEEEGIKYNGDIQTGIMIETPAAALISDELAEFVDFMSIGTNDLTQYTLAIDRQNQRLELFYNAHHKSVLKLIEMTVENAHAAGKWVGICGELAADMSMTKKFIEMGVDELSVVPSMILRLRKSVIEME